MIRKKRPTTIDLAALLQREPWAGMLNEPELTDAEVAALREHRRGTWVPGAALSYLWGHWDVHHGSTWSLAEFETALAADVAEIDQSLEDFPEQRQRLAWCCPNSQVSWTAFRYAYQR